MIGMFHASLPTPSGASSIFSTGSLSLIQKTPSHLSSQANSKYNVNPFDGMSRYNLPEVLDFYSYRNGKRKLYTH